MVCSSRFLVSGFLSSTSPFDLPLLLLSLVEPFDRTRPKLSAAGTKPRIGSDDRGNAILGLMQNLFVEGLGPQWIRPAPPTLPVLDGELIWLNPDSNHELLWDYGMCADTSRGAAVRDLIDKA
ncbi:hypothetical protein ZIOFF_049410 [Zingiber officinale]|uniref:CCR4-NOT transcription complex subunit 11 n=1 Tax=Zingiber officinale TaxID=94328 RepID=A0A8J5FWU5_ZINOF|nr:hypothetical protein ZIOFF_049410 [Zingiber officinale]